MLVIDYGRHAEHYDNYHEFSKKEDLETHLLNTHEMPRGPRLRLIHVQNATWAKSLLQKRFNMFSNPDIMDTLSGNAEYRERTNQDAMDILLRARVTDVWYNQVREINRASFECDFLKGYERSSDSHTRRQKPWLEFRYHDKRNPRAPRHDIHVDEISVYLQWKCDHPRKPVEGPCNSDGGLDNGNTIIIFSDSVRDSLRESLIGARRGKEIQWTRLATQLKHESARMDDAFVSNCMEYVLNDIIKSVLTNWSRLSIICETHVGILEQKSKTHRIQVTLETDSLE